MEMWDGAIERCGKYYSGVITEAMEGIVCREMQGSREKVLGIRQHQEQGEQEEQGAG